ncbi:hypothetical protein [Corynebacterium sp. HS2168-gen11]|uniref:hypothetical protein n=1 Tax=Corynebacterium sp. HS2168-gen11 TaxID=2974027 RepID=UPI00216AEC47|nr:hypothetical protein [Corynebacterium sp. HS2168-gen11]MCS4535363.1 hypothetical protein [Corynebacterium sp. HS2168-gen11]
MTDEDQDFSTPFLIRNYGSGASAEVTRMGLRVLLEHEKFGIPRFEWGIFAYEGAIWKCGKEFAGTVRNLRALVAKYRGYGDARDVIPQFFADCCIQSAGGVMDKQSLWMRYIWSPNSMSHDRETLKFAKQRLKTYMRHNPNAFSITNMYGFERCLLLVDAATPTESLRDYIQYADGSYIGLLQDFANSNVPDFELMPFVTNHELDMASTIGEIVNTLRQ